MSKVLGIIAEYNPFHNGHLYHLNKSKELTNSNYTIAVIGGNFTQRGDTSIINKWDKAKMALDNGIDLVIELPVLYAISSAENFADGAIKILNSLGIVDYISFGSETNDIDNLEKIATILSDEPDEYRKILNSELTSGISFPVARENALKKYLGIPANDTTLPISSPNNILGIEYIKALKKYKSNIKPISIERYKTEYNNLEHKNNIASATAIRELIKNKNYEELQNLLPQSSYNILKKQIQSQNIITDLSCFEKEIIYTLRKMTIDEIAELPDVSEGLENVIKKASNSSSNLSQLLDTIKSKRYTRARLQRILLYALLGITKKDIKISRKINPYIRVLGFNENGKKLLSKISKTKPELKIVTSTKKFVDSNTNKDLQTLIDKDILSTNIYTIGLKDFEGNLDFTKKIIVS